jgi:DNA-binding XRE family transcriptional regulator
LFGINRSNIGSYEEARAEPKLEILIKISTHFKLTVDQMIRKELTVNEIAGFQLEYDAPLNGKKSKSVDERLDEILERLGAIEKRLGQVKKDK